MANTGYKGSDSKTISSSYLYTVIQNFKTKYIDGLITKSNKNETDITNLTTRVGTLEGTTVVFEDTDLDLTTLV